MGSQSAHCPEPEILSEFASGRIQNNIITAQISNHIENCPTCVARLDQLDTKADALVSQVQQASHDQSIDEDLESGCERALRNIIDLVPDEQNHSPLKSSQAGHSTDNLAAQTRHGLQADPNAPSGVVPSRMIGPYQLLEKIGAGGMGVVYKALHTKMNRHVALKLLPAEKTGNDEAARRFEREMQAAGKLAHPNIVVGYDAGESNGHCFLAMELLDGIELSTLANVHNGPVKTEDACELIRQAATGLSFAHQNGIVHRDVKPSNILLCNLDSFRSTESGTASPSVTVKLLDLGLARLDRDGSFDESMTSTNQVVGTIDYMSPEQCLDCREVDARSDIYSLGATLFRLLAGRTLWAGPEYGTQGRKLKALLFEQAPSLADLRSDLPTAVTDLVDRTLKREPSERFQSIDELIDAITPLANGSDLEGLLRDTESQQRDKEFTLRPKTDQLTFYPAEKTSDKPKSTLTNSEPFPSSDEAHPPRAINRWLMLAGFPIALIALGIIWLRSDGGYIRIESDPSVAVQVEILKDGKQVDSVEIGNGENEFWYRSGQYEIRLPAGADEVLTIEGERLILYRNGTRLVTISRLTEAERNDEVELSDNNNDPGRNPSGVSDGRVEPAGQIAGTTDSRGINRHEVARWVVNHSGDMSTEQGVIRTEEDIPAGAFEVHSIGLKDASDDDVRKVCAWVERMPDCKRLYLNGGHAGRLTDRSMLLVNRLKHLTWLSIESSNITDEGLAQIKFLPNLHDLRLQNLRITGESLKYVAKAFPQLVVLGISSQTVTDQDLNPIVEMKDLRVLDLTFPRVSAEVLTPISRTSVYRLGFRGVAKFDEGVIRSVAGLGDLEVFALQNSRFGDAELKELSETKSIRTLDLGGTDITVEGLRQFIEKQPDVEILLKDSESPLLELQDLPQVKNMTYR